MTDMSCDRTDRFRSGGNLELNKIENALSMTHRDIRSSSV